MNMHYHEEILKILTPLLGKNTSEASLNLQCKKLGIPENSIAREHLNDLGQKLFPGLKMFLGVEKANQVVDLITKIK